MYSEFYEMKKLLKRSLKGMFMVVLGIGVFLFTIGSFSEVIDCVAGVVNGEVITLTDIKIVNAFGLYENESKREESDPVFTTLEKLINQKLILQLTNEKIPISPEEIEQQMQKIIERIGTDGFQKKLSEFSLQITDLKEYIRNEILYQKIIYQKFSPGAMVSLKEIESYYTQIYVPSQEKNNIRPQPMVEVLKKIEAAIIEEKTKKQAEEWITNIRKKADIQIKIK